MTERNTPATRRSLALVLVACCFFASGAAGLLYETVWLRLLGLLFGHTVYAITTVLAAYMGGLAVGSRLLGPWADRLSRPLRAYGLLEAAIGAYCLATPLLFRLVDAGYVMLSRAFAPGPVAATAIQFFLSILLLIGPTVLMGATLPVLSRVVVERDGGAAARVGTLYAINTWGAVVGVAATGFLLLPWIGLRATLLVGVAVNALVAGVALVADGVLARSRPRAATAPSPLEPAIDPDADVRRTRTIAIVTLCAIAISGAASMVYEIAWTRALSLVLGSSTYAFSAMLTTFLAGLAIGAMIASAALRRRALDLRTFAWIELVLAFAAVLSLPALGRLPDAVVWLFERWGTSHHSAIAAQFAFAAAVMIIPTVLIGATLPLAVACIVRGRAHVGSDVGRAYAANTVGTIVGALLGGFALLPAVGIQNAVLVAAGCNVAAGVAAVLATVRSRRGAWVLVPVASFGALCALVPAWDVKVMTSGAAIYAQEYVGERRAGASLKSALAAREVLFYDEGMNTTVAVVRWGDHMTLKVNGKADGGNGKDMTTQLLLGHLPALMLPRAERALVIGLGTGVTAGALSLHPVGSIEVAELEPAMRDAAALFRAENHDVLKNPKVQFVAGDGRHVLASSPTPYDIVISEPSNPWIAGVGNLFTEEFYRIAAARLAKDGLFVQWLQGYQIFPREMRMVVRTLQQVFPHVSMWKASSGDYLLVASASPQRLDVPAWERILAESPGRSADFRRMGITAGDLASRVMLWGEDVHRYFEGAPTNTDDLPLLEFSAPRALYATDAVSRNEELIASFRRDTPGELRRFGVEEAATEEAWVAKARRAWLDGHLDRAREVMREATRFSDGDEATALEHARMLFVAGRVEDAAHLIEARLPRDPAARAYLDASREIAARNLGLPLTHEVALATPADGASAREQFGRGVASFAVRYGVPAALPIALEHLQAAVRDGPPSADLDGAIVLVLIQMGKHTDALAWARKAAATHAGDARAHFAIGMACEANQLVREAAAHYRDAARLAPSWDAPRSRLRAIEGT